MLPYLAYFSKKKMFYKKPKQNLTTISKRKVRKEKKNPNIMHIRFARHLLHL